MYKKIVTVCLIAGMVLTGCAGKSGSTTNSSEAKSKDGNVREIHYFSSRSASDDTMVALLSITSFIFPPCSLYLSVISCNVTMVSSDADLEEK